MAFKSSKPSGITRVSENSDTRPQHKKEENTSKNGKFCAACNKYFSYLRPQDKHCTSCSSRKSSVRQ